MKNIRLWIFVVLSAGAVTCTPQFRLNLGQLFGAVAPPRNNNNQNKQNNQNTQRIDPLQIAGGLFGNAVGQFLNNTDVKIGPDGIKIQPANGQTGPRPPSEQTLTCPPLPGEQRPSGCNLSIVQDIDGEIDCEVDDDCPYSFTWWNLSSLCEADGYEYSKCVNKRCEFTLPRRVYLCKGRTTSCVTQNNLIKTDKDSFENRYVEFLGSPESLRFSIEKRVYRESPCENDDECKFLRKDSKQFAEHFFPFCVVGQI